jgi:uncharacterized protein YvpB
MHWRVTGPVPQVCSTHLEVVVVVPAALRVLVKTQIWPAAQLSGLGPSGMAVQAMAAQAPVVIFHTRAVQVARVFPAPAQSS